MSHSQVLEWISGSFIQSHWPVTDVVSDLHVLDALGVRERGGAEQPPCARPAQPDDESGGDVEGALEQDGAPDVGGVAGTERLFDIASDGVEFGAQCLDVGVGQMRVGGNVGYRHGPVLSVGTDDASISATARSATRR
jgi:hypothetical protein